MNNHNLYVYNFKPSTYSQKAAAIYQQQRFSRKIALVQRNGLSQADFDIVQKQGLYAQSILENIPIKETKKKADRPKHKLHIRNKQLKKLKAEDMPFVTAKKLALPLKTHDFEANKYILSYRIRMGIRPNTRTCKEDGYQSVFPCLIRYCDYDLRSDLPLEVKASVKQIAYDMGLLEGTTRCDRLYTLLNEMQEAGLIVVVYEFNNDICQQKAARIFLLPDFFYSVGHTKESLSRILSQFNHSPKSKLDKASIEKRNKEHEERLRRQNVADILANPKNREKYRLLKSVRRELIAQSEAYQMLKMKKASKPKANPYKRPELPKCPLNAKFGSANYGNWCRTCINIINKYWKEILHFTQSNRAYWQALPSEELALLMKFYKNIGDSWAWMPIAEILNSRRAS